MGTPGGDVRKVLDLEFRREVRSANMHLVINIIQVAVTLGFNESMQGNRIE